MGVLELVFQMVVAAIPRQTAKGAVFLVWTCETLEGGCTALSSRLSLPKFLCDQS